MHFRCSAFRFIIFVNLNENFQAARDRVDVIVLSIGPDEPPRDTVTFMNVFDMFLLFARRAGIFVVQAAGNKGPGESTVISYSPWVMGVASSTTGRTYTTTILLGDGHQLQGVSLSGLPLLMLICGFFYLNCLIRKFVMMIELSTFPSKLEH